MKIKINTRPFTELLTKLLHTFIWLLEYFGTINLNSDKYCDKKNKKHKTSMQTVLLNYIIN